MIAEAAYFIAEHRGFSTGDPTQDWLAAEAEIDGFLSGTRPDMAEKAAAYTRLHEEVRKALSQLQDMVDTDALKGAFEHGMKELRQLGNFSASAMHHAAVTLREDMAHAAERMGPSWEHFSERRAGLFSVWKDRSREFLHHSARAVHQWLHPEDHGPEH